MCLRVCKRGDHAQTAVTPQAVTGDGQEERVLISLDQAGQAFKGYTALPGLNPGSAVEQLA